MYRYVAEAVSWYYSQLPAKQTSGKPMPMTFLLMTLFVIYGTFLAQRGSRLTAEHPQMWQYRPVFPRVFKKLSKDETAPREAAAI